MAPGRLPVLSRLERRIIGGVLVAGLLVLAVGIVAVVQRDRIVVWLTGDEVAAAERTVRTVGLPSGLTDDPTLSACASWSTLRCAWSDAPAADAAQLVVAALEGVGLEPGPVVCDDPTVLPDELLTRGPACVAQVPVKGEHLWVLAMDRTPEGEVPLGRTAAWITWDEAAMSTPMLDRLASERTWADPATVAPLTAADVAGLLPTRLESVLDAPCRTATADGCFDWKGPVDLADLGDDAGPRLVAELTAAGFFVDAADADLTSTGVRAHRFVDAETRRGLMVSVQLVDGVAVAQVFTL